MLAATDVTKRYGEVNALDRLSLSVQPGEIVAILGANGAGKTTFIKCALGLVHFEGSVKVNGVDVARHGKEARRSVGYLPQNPALHGDLTIQETATFYASLRRVSGDRAREVVATVGLTEQAQKRVSALSGGMRQRLALALATLADPPLLMLDEPASSLDIAARLDLRGLLQRQRAAGKAILLSTHWLEDVPFIADRVVVLDQGRPVFLGAAHELTTNGAPTGSLYLRLNGRSGEAVDLLRSLELAEAVDRSGDWLVVTCEASQKAGVIEALRSAGITILDLHVEQASIENAVARLASRQGDDM